MRCATCNKRLPVFMFGKPGEGWKTVTGRNYSCRLCRFTSPYRYTAHTGPMGRKLEQYTPTLRDRMKEFLK